MKETVTEQLLAQQLESPSGTGRDDPGSTTLTSPTPVPIQGSPLTHAFSLGKVRYLVGWSKVWVWPWLVATVLVACGSTGGENASVDSFCAAADQLFNRGSFADDGSGVVEALRALDLGGLNSADNEAMVTATDTIEANIKAFVAGAAPDGWSTSPAATEAARICQRDMQQFFVMP